MYLARDPVDIFRYCFRKQIIHSVPTYEEYLINLLCDM